MSRQGIENEAEVNIPEDRRCVYRFADGRRCRVRRWGAQLCFHHDPAAAEKRKNRGRYFSRLPILTATEINELLLRTLKRLCEGGQILQRLEFLRYAPQLQHPSERLEPCQGLHELACGA